MLPATVDPTRGNIITSYGDGTTPEQALAAAVIMRAIEDLESDDETVRFEAHEFFLQPDGPWAEMRRFYFEAVQLDDEWLLQHLQHRLEPPERPDKKWTYLEVLEHLPRDRPFTSQDVTPLTTLHPSQMTTRIHHLIRSGDVVRLEPGLYCVTAFEPEYRRRLLQAIADEPAHKPVMPGKTPGQNRVLEALQDGPMTAREIQIATETGGWDMLRGMVLDGLLVKDGTKYQLAPQSPVAA